MTSFRSNPLRWLFAGDAGQSPGRLAPRWLFVRALGLIFLSAFYSLLFQVRGLIGPEGLLPAGDYLHRVADAVGWTRYWDVPTVLWLGAGTRALLLLAWLGIIASLLLVANVWPRGMVLVCVVAFASFIAVLQDFSSYQSDGMLLEAGFVSLFFAPAGFWPRWGERQPPSRASLFLLQWLWFRIYFESGLAKILSGDVGWRHLTAMNGYYQNGPLPTWMGWYAAQLPGWFHRGTGGLTLALELVIVWALFLPRRFRIVLFWTVTPWEIGIILTSNYAFLNYLVLALGVLLLDDKYLARLLPAQGARLRRVRLGAAAVRTEAMRFAPEVAGSPETQFARASNQALARNQAARVFSAVRLGVSVFFLSWVFYATTALLIWMVAPSLPLPLAPVEALQPARLANRFGLFAVMTPARYEIEFQGSQDGTHWTAYTFRYKPQDPRAAPRFFAPYQPRFDWNLWFASLADWQQNNWILVAEERLLTNSPAVMPLFAGNPFVGAPPQQVRAVLWRYWFADRTERRQGLWWDRQLVGLYAPSLERLPNGKFGVIAIPDASATGNRP